jgi:hypothetical protein
MKESGIKHFILLGFCSLVSFFNNSYSSESCLSDQSGYQAKYQFVKPMLSFAKYNGLEFRLSESYLSYPNGNTVPDFAIALEIKNNSKDELTKLTFRVKLFDKQGKLVNESLNNCGPLTFMPSKGKTIPVGYTGIYERFCTKEKNFLDTFGKIEIDLVEVGIAPKDLYDKPVFEPEWKTFEGFKGFEFRLSKPYKFLDDLSGNTLFAIAIEFRNKTGKAVKFLNFNQKVYDDQGLLVDREVQNHNMMYEPADMKNEKFPAGYSGINMMFYTNDLKFFEKFQKIEYHLVTVEY